VVCVCFCFHNHLFIIILLFLLIQYMSLARYSCYTHDPAHMSTLLFCLLVYYSNSCKTNEEINLHLNINDEMYKSKILSCICVLFYSLFVVYMRMRISTSKQHKCVQGPLRECCSIRLGASGLHYCTSLVCISVVIGLLAGITNQKPKTKKILQLFGASSVT